MVLQGQYAITVLVLDRRLAIRQVFRAGQGGYESEILFSI